MRPYAELIKRWADDPTMEIEFLSVGDKWEASPNPTWHPSLLYREKPKEKKKIEMWQWAIRNGATPEKIVASKFYKNTDSLQEDYHFSAWKIICRIEGSKIEVEE
jgi:hypothetical protein